MYKSYRSFSLTTNCPPKKKLLLYADRAGDTGIAIIIKYYSFHPTVWHQIDVGNSSEIKCTALKNNIVLNLETIKDISLLFTSENFN